jgi:hypothetical protein
MLQTPPFEVRRAVGLLLARRWYFRLAENYPSLRQIVGRDLDAHTIPRDDSDEIFAHFTGDMREHNVPIRQFQPEHCARQDIDHNSFSNNRLFFRHRETSAFIESSARNQPIERAWPKFGALPDAR